MIRRPVLFAAAAFLAAGIAVTAYVAWNWNSRKGDFRGRPIPAVKPGTFGPTIKEPPREGFPTPDAALDAYVKALREKDISACKATMTRERLQHDEDWIRGQSKNPDAPGAMEKGWRGIMGYYLGAEWREGQYKRFPVEMDAPDKASIVCVFQNNAKGAMDRCRRYVFVKEEKGWLQADWLDAEVKVLDPNKYPYSWEQAKPPDKPAPAEQDK